jgi:hypothetical protein
MATMPSRHARCVFYSNDNTSLGLGKVVERWFTSTRGPSAQGTIEVRGRQGNIYHLGTLAEESQKHREWPIEVFDLLRNRGSMPDALLVMWKD